MLRTSSPLAAATAISEASANGSESSIHSMAGGKPVITSASGSDPDDWFGSLARPLLGKEPGVALHYIVGSDFPISTCSKYVAKTEASRRQPSGYLIRALLRSEQGEPFFRALMDGCTAQWWIDFEHQQELGAKVIAMVKS